MELTLKYLTDDGESTLGDLFINGKRTYSTLVPSDKKTPPGRYKVELRMEGGKFPHYLKKYGTKGMIWIRKVLGKTFIYIHIGNRAKNSKGCQLMGMTACRNPKEQYLYDSTTAYKEFHKLIVKTLAVEEVFITVV